MFIGVHKVIFQLIGSRIPLFPKHEPLQHGLHEAAQAQVDRVQAPAETVKCTKKFKKRLKNKCKIHQKSSKYIKIHTS